MNKPIMTEEDVNLLIERLNFCIKNFGVNTGNRISESETLSSLSTALAQWIRIKNDVVNREIDKSLIEPHKKEEEEPKDDGEVPF